MAAGKYNFTIEQGTTVDFEVAYKDSNSSPIDLTNYTGRMQLKDKVGGSTTHIILNSSLANDGTGLNFNATADDSDGTIGVFISANSSSAFNFTQAVYDLEIISGSDFPIVTRLLEGVVKLSKEVTTAS